jgi:hypothetical protein
MSDENERRGKALYFLFKKRVCSPQSTVHAVCVLLLTLSPSCSFGDLDSFGSLDQSLDSSGGFSYDDDGCTIAKSTISPRKGGPKAYRLERSKILDTIPTVAPPATASLSKPCVRGSNDDDVDGVSCAID